MTAIQAVTSAADAVYAAADEVLAQRGQSFHWARHLLSNPHAERATLLYGFCRRIDDLADEGQSSADASLALAKVRQALQTGQSDDPALRDVLQLMRACGIDPAVPLELVRGLESDLGEVRVADMAELLRYCYRVAGTVGLMMTAALDVTAPEALPHAIDLGIAMPLTNIYRDVSEDALRGRRYLPATLVHTLLDLADRHYASGERGLHLLPANARAGNLVAASVYREIGVVLPTHGGII